jgi:hypothetical protein
MRTLFVKRERFKDARNNAGGGGSLRPPFNLDNNSALKFK